MTDLPWAVSLDLAPTVRIVSLADGGDLETAPDVAILWRPGAPRSRDEAIEDAERIVAAVNGDPACRPLVDRFLAARAALAKADPHVSMVDTRAAIAEYDAALGALQAVRR